MSAAELLLSLTGSLTLLLLSVTAYFLKLLVQDTRQLQAEVAKLKQLFVRLESEQLLLRSIIRISRSPPSSRSL